MPSDGGGRDKEHSTIIYESGEPDLPLLRLGWNKQDPRYLATLVMDSAKVSARQRAMPAPDLAGSCCTVLPACLLTSVLQQL